LAKIDENITVPEDTAQVMGISPTNAVSISKVHNTLLRLISRLGNAGKG
jgi:hypothetical protein